MRATDHNHQYASTSWRLRYHTNTNQDRGLSALCLTVRQLYNHCTHRACTGRCVSVWCDLWNLNVLRINAAPRSRVYNMEEHSAIKAVVSTKCTNYPSDLHTQQNHQLACISRPSAGIGVWAFRIYILPYGYTMLSWRAAFNFECIYTHYRYTD